MRKSTFSAKQFGFERLEDRAVLNGTVMASGAGGTLTLTGDAANNAIVVHQVGTNSDGSGAIIQVLGAGTKINNTDTTTTGTSFTFGSGTGNGITSITIDLGGGRDTLTFANTTVSSDISVMMDDAALGPDGNDVLAMTNVHSSGGMISVDLGGGTNVAVLSKVTSGLDFTLTAGDGRNAIALNNVRSSQTPSAPSGTFTVTLGSGRFNSVVMVSCSDGTDGTLDITDGGADGVLVGALNSFGTQMDVTTFRFRAGDLRNNT
jgi:hypothetical protein